MDITPVKMIVATDANYGIGKDNDLLFKIPEDMNFFKNTTMNNIVVMGMGTYKSIGCTPLKGRYNIILTTNKHMLGEKDNNQIFMTGKQFKEWLKTEVPDNKDVFIIGGGSVYEQYIDYCDTLYITTYNKAFKGVDTYFPNILEHGFTPATASSTLIMSGSICSGNAGVNRTYWWTTKWEKSPEQYAAWCKQCGII